MRHRFSKEMLLAQLCSPLQRVYGPEITPPPSSNAVLTSTPAATQYAPQELKRKPNGEVTRLAREGYNLRDALNWSEDVYSEVQVIRLSVRISQAHCAVEHP